MFAGEFRYPSIHRAAYSATVMRLGAPLAHRLGGPLLLTARDRLSPATADEVRRLAARSAVLLGGHAAIASQVEADLRRAGVDEVRRLAGNDRFGTARRVAERLGGRTVYVAEGAHPDPARGWPDAVAVSALAARQGAAVLLTLTDHLPEETSAALVGLDARRATVVGGRAAVSEAVADALRDPDGDGTAQVAVERVAGPSRYDTSWLVADRTAAAGGDATSLWAATGRGWPDALAAGPAVAATGGVLLLVDGRDVLGAPATWGWVADRAGSVASLRLVGGDAAIAAHVARSAQRVLDTGRAPVGDPFDAPLAVDRAADLVGAAGPRPAGGTADQAARDWLVTRFEEAGWEVAVEPFALPQGGSSANVVAVQRGDPRDAAHVVVGGHLDTVAGSPGANDNASGIGTLVALARELADEPTAVPLVLVGFGAEEFQPSDPPRHHVGSDVYAAAHADRVAGMVSVDMIGDGSPTCLCWYQAGPATMAQRL
ncbi:MAG TPA: cell wall-binding repeat-containing protein, partial [Nitriliruptorales bacterium]|nr:cell wall-binding repeat-containing protein [Nitriliruptorales bacterium]